MSTGPTPAGASRRRPRRRSAPGSMRAPASTARHATSASRKRPAPAASTAHARPMPTSANPSDGRSHSAASRSASSAAATSDTGSTPPAGTVAESSVVPGVAPSRSSGEALAEARGLVLGAGRRGLERGHGSGSGSGSGNDQPSGETGTSPIRASGTPADRSSAARSAGYASSSPPGLSASSHRGDDLVERPEPRDARDPGVHRRARARGDRLVEVALDQPREPLVELVGLRLEHATGAHRVEEQQPRHPAMARERGEDRVDRGLRAGDGLGLGGHRALDLRDELVGRRRHELAEDRLLGREVEVDPALGGLGGARDVVDGRLAIAARRERVERRVEDPLAAAPALFGGIGTGHRCPLASGPTDWSVGRLRGHRTASVSITCALSVSSFARRLAMPM